MRSSASITPTLLFKMKLLIIWKGLQIFWTITLVLSTKRHKLKYNIHIKVTLITSQMKTQIPFSSHQQTKKKLNWFSNHWLSGKQRLGKITPYSIPTKVIKLLKNDISDQLADLFNVSFTVGSLPTLINTAKIIHIHKKSQN